MTFDLPVTFKAALGEAQSRNVMPTNLNSAQLKGLNKALRMRSFFSARVNNAGFLQRAATLFQEFIEGKIGMAEFRLGLKDYLKSIGYEAEEGKEGTIEDLMSDGRLNLIFNTNLSQISNFGMMKAYDTETLRYSYPAWELVRVFWRKEPRDIYSDLTWAERWDEAGGELVDGRMIALKNDAVWEELGSSDLFKDGLDAPMPPFAFNSGMAWRNVPRDECIELGLISEDDEGPAEGGKFGINDGVKLNTEGWEPGLLDELKSELREGGFLPKLTARAAVEAGDLPGHKFHGNQWTDLPTEEGALHNYPEGTKVVRLEHLGWSSRGGALCGFPMTRDQMKPYAKVEKVPLDGTILRTQTVVPVAGLIAHNKGEGYDKGMPELVRDPQ